MSFYFKHLGRISRADVATRQEHHPCCSRQHSSYDSRSSSTISQRARVRIPWSYARSSHAQAANSSEDRSSCNDHVAYQDQRPGCKGKDGTLVSHHFRDVPKHRITQDLQVRHCKDLLEVQWPECFRNCERMDQRQFRAESF